MITEIKDKATWDQFLIESGPNTFLHTWQWGDLQLATGENIRRIGIYKDNQLHAVALIILVNAKRGRHYLIPHGPIMKTRDNLSGCLKEIASYAINHSTEDKCVALKVAPLAINTPANRKLFSQYGFRPAPLHVHTELTWVVDIGASEDEILAAMRKTSRHAIQKAAKNGVSTQVVTDPISALSRFWPLYEKTTGRHGFVPFSKQFIEKQLEIFSQSGSIFTIIASLNGHDLAAGIFVNTGHSIFYHHGASVKASSSISPAHAVQWAAIREGKKRGARQLNMWGIAPENEPNHPFAGITVFKKGFGGKTIDYMHAQDLPLSIGYWKLWAVDVIRKFRRGF